jgi:hypothetical protein
MGKVRNKYKISIGKPEGKLEDLGIDGTIILMPVVSK